MTAFATLATAVKLVWTRLAERDTAAAVAGLGPNLHKEAGLSPETGARF